MTLKETTDLIVAVGIIIIGIFGIGILYYLSKIIELLRDLLK